MKTGRIDIAEHCFRGGKSALRGNQSLADQRLNHAFRAAAILRGTATASFVLVTVCLELAAANCNRPRARRLLLRCVPPSMSVWRPRRRGAQHLRFRSAGAAAILQSLLLRAGGKGRHRCRPSSAHRRYFARPFCFRKWVVSFHHGADQLHLSRADAMLQSTTPSACS